LVLSVVGVRPDSLPTHLLDHEVPGIIESSTWRMMATEEPNFLNLLVCDD
jgi:hypothetical protein